MKKETDMEGYVKNITPVWTHAMKRSIGPGAEIKLSELYDQYGQKHDLKKGIEFVTWLRTVKLRDTNKWKVFYDGDIKDSEEIVDSPKKVVEGYVAPMVPSKMELKDVVLLSVRKARDIIPKIKDLNLLRYALKEANQLSGKDTLCILLRKRIKDLQAGR